MVPRPWPDARLPVGGIGVGECLLARVLYFRRFGVFSGSGELRVPVLRLCNSGMLGPNFVTRVCSSNIG